MNLDLTPVWQLLDPAIAAVAVIIGGKMVSVISTFLHIKNNSVAQDDLDQALEHGGALAIDWYKSLESHNGHVEIPANKLDQIVAHVLSLAPTAETVLGVTPDTVAALVQSKLTTWMHWSGITQSAPQALPAEPAMPQPTAPVTQAAS